MRVRIIGAGSLGMLFAGKLAGVCSRTELVAHSAKQAGLLRSEGLRVTENGLTAVASPLVVLHSGETLPNDGPLDMIIVAVKQFHITPEFARFVSRQMTERTAVVCFQNGTGHMDVMAEFVPRRRLLTAVTTEAALKRSDCEVEHTGFGTTWIGAEAADTGDTEADLQKKLVHLLESAGFAASASNNMVYNVWHKLIVNSIINPLTAILRVQNGQLAQNEASVRLMRRMLSEASALALAKGLEPPGPSWEQLIDICRKTAANRSSMLQDLEAGRRTEIDRITGSLLAEARRLGVDMPAHESVYWMVKALEGAPPTEAL